MSTIANKLQDAIQQAGYVPEPELTTYLWKGPKKVMPDGTLFQEQHRLIDCSLEQLQGFQKHCQEMLYNRDNKNPGRIKVKEEIYQQIIKCNAELFIREQILQGTTRFLFLDKIRQLLNENSININALKGLTLKDVIKNDLFEYADIPVEIVIDACLDKIGLFNRQHITTTFILKQGLWLTSTEYKEHEINLKEKSKKDIEEYFKKVLNVNKKHTLKITSSGLSLAQLREALSIKDMKYSQMGTEKLKILRDKLLFILLTEVDNHIDQWNSLLLKIQQVINFKFPVTNEPTNNQ